MSDFWFPKQIKPLTNKTYSTSRGSNVIASPINGGLPAFGLDTTLESPPFTLNFILSDLQYQVLLQFYDQKINHGASSFKMLLDSGNGVEEHQCNVLPGTWNVSRPSHGTWFLSMQVVAEVTSSQLDDCDAVYNLYECYGDDLARLPFLAESAIERLPNAI